MAFFNPFKSNFVRIAENTTKYYLTLSNSYYDRFPDEVSLLATAGALDAQSYVFIEKPQISLKQIMDLAQQAASGKQKILIDRLLSKIGLREKQELLAYMQPLWLTKPLIYFIFTLEVEIFKADNQSLGESDITMACLRKLSSIEKAIEKTKEKYQSKDLFAKATANFMEAPDFRDIRGKLRIKG